MKVDMVLIVTHDRWKKIIIKTYPSVFLSLPVMSKEFNCFQILVNKVAYTAI